MRMGWLAASTESRTNNCLQENRVPLQEVSSNRDKVLRKTMILLCCSVLVKLQCSLVLDNLNMWRKGMNASNVPGVLEFNCCHVLMHGCCFDKWSA